MKGAGIVAVVAIMVAIFFEIFKFDHQKGDLKGFSEPISVTAENARQLDSLRRFADSMKAAPPGVVRVKAISYIKHHDTIWSGDTIHDTVAALTEVTRWLTISDSTCRQKLDSTARMDSMHITQRDGVEVARAAASDSLAREKKAFHPKDAGMGAIGTVLLFLVGAIIFLTR